MYTKLTVPKPTSIVPGQTYDQSLANKFYGFFANEDVYVAGVCWRDLTTNDKVVFQRFRANYTFNQYNIEGFLLANNATTQTMNTANNTPDDALVPVAKKTQFSVVPMNQLIQTGFIVLAGDGSGNVKVGDLLYKKIPTANDTPLDLITSYSFAQGSTIDYATYIPLGVKVEQINLTLNAAELYPNRVLCIGQSLTIQPTTNPTIANMQPVDNSKEFAEIKAEIEKLSKIQSSLNENEKKVIDDLAAKVQELKAQLEQKNAESEKPSEVKPKGDK